ncbi:hypothetical protein J2W94_001250 [Pseudoxanthomonas sacheonensis]|uniref:Uncharacterized protein n=1 Tax=Pseudoxanthomonas sacheonensis TaxID=443615 RepID=A0ABU1RQC3_9GAMM|nr:hypothetical protein [Pseudoxanthomonas sacheonensis]
MRLIFNMMIIIKNTRMRLRSAPTIATVSAFVPIH